MAAEPARPEPTSRAAHLVDVELPAQSQLRARRATIYRLSYGPTDALGALDASDLTTEERRRAAGYLFAEDRFAFTAGRLLVRRLLSAETGMPPSRIALRLDRGRPYLPKHWGHDLTFSISHTEGLVMVAIAREAMVGVDVEKITMRPDFDGISDIVFTEAERSFLVGAAVAKKVEAFFRLWVRKEAILKYRGTGFAGGARSVDVLDGMIPKELNLVDGGDDADHAWCAVSDGTFSPTGPVDVELLPARS
ncbi:MAG: 4'-phosphopantetheinyl transferase superfamily protein [Alphaproteobacteria bacterium]|nr:4'-phosphopantetheinyl transferase superfamily protein [Alphaproteobacteria bacterium]